MIPKVTVKQAAKIMGKGQTFVREGLRRGILPFGSALQGEKRANFYIRPKAFCEYVGISMEELESNEGGEAVT